MANHTRIDEILRDLAALDPIFRDAAKVRPLVEALLALQPQEHIDEEFKNRLRRELLASTSTLPTTRTSFADLFASWGRLALGRPYAGLAYAGAGALAAILILVGITYGPSLFVGRNFNNVEVVRVGERAFGNLTTQGGFGMGASAMKGGAESAPTPEGDIAVRSVTPVFGMGGGGGGGIVDMPSSLIYPAPDVPRIDFVYSGTLPEIGATVDVLRRVKPAGVTGGFTNTLRRFAMGLLNLDEFSDANVESFSLAEDEPFGYTVYVNPLEGMISIGQNWRQWPPASPELLRGEQTMDGPGVMEGTVAMPTESDLVTIANAFLDEYDIARDEYGAPVVQTNWGVAVPLEKATMPVYMQEISIVYPYLVDGASIYNEGGDPFGLYVGVNVRERRVSNVSGLMTRRYESSSYAAEGDIEKLLGYAENRYWAPEGARTIVVEVGVPTPGYMNSWTWNGMEGYEVVVPALIFPVPQNLAIPNMYFPRNLVVPLAKDIIDRNGGGPVHILQ